jgi:hypothetical protein
MFVGSLMRTGLKGSPHASMNAAFIRAPGYFGLCVGVARTCVFSLIVACGAVVAQDAASSFDGSAFPACVEGLRPQAEAAGVTRASFDRLTRSLRPEPSVLGFLDAQPEFVIPIWDYLAGLVDDERVTDGRAMLARWGEVLQRVETEFSVDPATVVAVWGVESDFGRRFGERPLLESLSTLACFGRRQSFFRGEFVTSLKILQEGHVAPEKLRGSWAGAFGHTQLGMGVEISSTVSRTLWPRRLIFCSGRVGARRCPGASRCAYPQALTPHPWDVGIVSLFGPGPSGAFAGWTVQPSPEARFGTTRPWRSSGLLGRRAGRPFW